MVLYMKGLTAMHQPDLKPDERRQHTIAAVATFTTFMHAYERGELTTAADAQIVFHLDCGSTGRHSFQVHRFRAKWWFASV